MTAKKISKTDRIPKFRSLIREVLNTIILESPEYIKKIKEGLPFFSKDQLEEINNKYKEGITWNEIEAELSKKGLILKKPTFQKYIRDQLISDKIDYKINSKGRMAVYHAEIIEQINFVQYLYKATDNQKFLDLLNSLQELTINGLEKAKIVFLEANGSTDNLFVWLGDYIKEIPDLTAEDLFLYPFLKTNNNTQLLEKHLERLEKAKTEIHTIFSDIIEEIKGFEVPYFFDDTEEDQNE